MSRFHETSWGDWQRDNEHKGALKTAAEDAIRQFIETLDGEETSEFYNLVLAEVEEPLLRVVMEYTANNQSRAAAMLGLNRGTLRKNCANTIFYD